MYNLKKTKRIFRDSPWNTPCKDRIMEIDEAKKSNRKTVAFLYPHFDASTFRYRGYNVAETLEYSFWWYGTYFQLNELRYLEQCLDKVDIVVIIRCAWNPNLEEFIVHARSKQVKICYDVDDLIYNDDRMESVIEALGLDQDNEWNFWFGLTKRNHMIANMCDAYITTNDFLAERLKSDFSRPCYVLHNYLNWMQEEVSEEYYKQKIAMEGEKPFEIGYFSGSPTHLNDLMIVMPELEEFLTKHENTRFRIVGYMDLPEKYEYLVESKKIVYTPFQSFTGLQYEQAKVDVSIVPLVNNEFSNCKSELKYFESAIVGTLTCATPSHTYSAAINNGENGYLCENGQWLTVFEKIYENGISKEQMGNIRKKALKVYSGINQLKQVEEILNKIYDL